MHAHSGSLRPPVSAAAIILCRSLREADEAAFSGHSNQRIKPIEINVIGDQHELTGVESAFTEPAVAISRVETPSIASVSSGIAIKVGSPVS